MLSLQALVFGSHKAFLWLKSFKRENVNETPVFQIELKTFGKSGSESNKRTSSTNSRGHTPRPNLNQPEKIPNEGKPEPLDQELQPLELQFLKLSQKQGADFGVQSNSPELDYRTQGRNSSTNTQPKYQEPKAMKILGLSRRPLKNQNSRNIYLQSAPLPPKFAIFQNPVFTLFIPFGLIAFLFLFLMNYYSESLTGFHGYLYNIWSCFFLPLIFLIITPKLQRFICKKLSCM